MLKKINMKIEAGQGGFSRRGKLDPSSYFKKNLRDIRVRRTNLISI